MESLQPTRKQQRPRHERWDAREMRKSLCLDDGASFGFPMWVRMGWWAAAGPLRVRVSSVGGVGGVEVVATRHTSRSSLISTEALGLFLWDAWREGQ